MKYFIVFLLISLPAFGDDCASCKLKNYPFIGCCTPASGWSKCIKCTNDPLNEPNFRSWKKCNLNTSLVDVNRSAFPYGAILHFENPSLPSEETVVFNESNSYDDCLNALLDWIICCMPEPTQNDDCDDCRLKIKWARKSEEMGEHPGALAITHQTPAYVDKCRSNCNDNYIAINATNEFMGCNPELDEYPKEYRFFYTNKSLHPNYKDKLHWYHFKSVIIHEIGHWLGLGDIGYGCNTPGANSSTTVMWKEIYDNQERDELSTDDCCMFKILYCCSSTSIEEKQLISEYDFEIIPNPATNEVLAQFNLNDYNNIGLYIVNPLGQIKKIIYNDIIMQEGKHSVNIDLNDYSNGMYRIILKINDKHINKNLLISK